jgi:hypothetical protein
MGWSNHFGCNSWSNVWMGVLMKAFPIANMEGNEEFLGMDLRDYFAANAMQVLLKRKFDENANESFQIEMLTIDAYEIADQMMKARKE